MSSRILVVGWELPEHAPGSRMEAANYRTWQLVQALLDDGHEVCLAAGRIGTEFDALPEAALEGRLLYHPVRFSSPGWPGRLRRLHDQFRPQGIVGVTFLGALRASRLRSPAPSWFDIYGDQMAEMQARAHQLQSDRGIATQLRFLSAILSAGDVFSACSGAQRHTLIGQLSTAGRLNAATFGYEFVHVVQPGASEVEDRPAIPLLRPRVVPEEARIVLWCGGYNTWTDVETLARGLQLAMARDSRLHFVSVGGELPGCNAYARFVGLTHQSAFRDRFHLLGWQPVARVPEYYREADLGIALDAACYEAELGTRTRLVEMLQYGLPIVTTEACELSFTIRDADLGATFPVGDVEALARQVLSISLDDQRRRQLSCRARAYAATSLSLARVTAPLRRWAARPYHAPDNRRTRRGGVFSIEHATRALVRQAMWAVAGLDK